MPINSEHLASLTDADVIDQNGDKVGGVGQIYLDDATGQAAWVSVKSGLFGLRESFVPLAGADVVDGNISVPYTKDYIKDAPRVDAENHLDDSQQATLFSYYGVDRGTVGGGGADETAAFGSEQTAQDLYDGRSEGVPAPVSESDRDGAVTSEYTTPGATDDLTTGSVAEGAGNDLGSGDVTDSDLGTADAGVSGSETNWARDAAAIGAGAAAGAGAAGVAAADSTTVDAPAADSATADSPTADSDTADSPTADSDTADSSAGGAESAYTGPSPHGTYQQENPAAQADWAAEQTPEEPVSTEWSVPDTDPAAEEATAVGRSGYSADQPAAHSSAYEGHTGAVSGAAGAAGAADAAGATHDAGEFGTVDPVTADDAVTGAADQTGTGYPAEADQGDVESDSSGFGGGAAAVGGVAAGGAAAAGLAASRTETTAYEVPGAETGDPITETEGGEAFATDLEEPVDAAAAPTEGAAGDTWVAGTDGGDAFGEPETFGAEGYRPDRDGTEMSDEERERLNEARGAL